MLLLLISKWYVYRSRDKGKVGLKPLLISIKRIKTTEENISGDDIKKKKRNESKWRKVHGIF